MVFRLTYSQDVTWLAVGRLSDMARVAANLGNFKFYSHYSHILACVLYGFPYKTTDTAGTALAQVLVTVAPTVGAGSYLPDMALMRAFDVNMPRF